MRLLSSAGANGAATDRPVSRRPLAAEHPRDSRRGWTS